MALHASTAWEFRATGKDYNGGGFYNRNPGTSVDYTQRDTAILSLSDLSAINGATTITSVTGGFTAAMAGNLIRIDQGTNFTAGYYEIVTYTNTNNVVLDKTPTTGGDAYGGIGNVGGALYTQTATFWNSVVAGNTVWIKKGTYIIGSALTVYADGTDIAPIYMYGYNITRGDNPRGNNRPSIYTPSYDFSSADYFIWKNLQFVITSTVGVCLGMYSVIRNCKVSQSAAGNAYGIKLHSTAGIAEDCEVVFTGNNCTSIYNGIYYGSGLVVGCSVRNWHRGIALSCSIFNLAIGCSDYGISPASVSFYPLVHNTVIGCGSGLYDSTMLLSVFSNNIAHCNYPMYNVSTSYQHMSFDYNNIYGCNQGRYNVPTGSHDTVYDPQFEGITVLKGTTATIASSILTDNGVDFSSVVNNSTYCALVSGTGVTAGVYKITSHALHTITFAANPGTSSAGNVIYYIVMGDNASLLPASRCIGAGNRLQLGVG